MGERLEWHGVLRAFSLAGGCGKYYPRFRLLIGYADDSISALWQAQTRQTRKIQARFGIC